MTSDAETTALLHTSVDLTEPAEVAAFTGTYFNLDHGMSIAVRSVTAEAWNSPVMLELGPRGPEPLTVDRSRAGMHIVHAGTPHRYPHRAGYWHIGTVDEIYVWTPPIGHTPGTRITFERHREKDDTDSTVWYCNRCNAPLYIDTIETGKAENWWTTAVAGTIAAVDTFNGNSDLRTCRECGEEHPLAYHLPTPEFPHPPEQEAARELW